MIKFDPDKPMHPLRCVSLNLQRFAGGSNLYCESCVYFENSYCELHQKRMDRHSESCSHYLGKRKL